ncbi:MAG TPA: hypothetical protein VFV98_16955 [Vicinamibacterales bacterium]|nr:hypothetical protein [Vicinamibacterales bacterium]
MRLVLRTLILTTAALVAAVGVYTGLTLPPAPQQLAPQWPALVAAGAYHIHSSRSDGTGTVDAIADAARRAGLAFVIITDHGDATRPPDPPTYRHGVLVIDAVEINTAAGHLVALGIAASSPYPLAGEARDVIEDVHRLGGKVVLAHPDSPRQEFAWQDPGAEADGIEWLNADAEWRDETYTRLMGAAVRSAVRPAAAVASLFARPDRSLRRWDRDARAHAEFGVAAVDAHARGLWESQEPRRSTWLPLPSYETMFRAVVQAVSLNAPLTGDPAADAASVLDGLTRGRSFSVIAAYAAPATLTFFVTTAAGPSHAGDRLPASSERAEWNAMVPEFPAARVVLLRDGKIVATGQGSVQHRGPLEAGVYRIEAFHPAGPAPWLASNPIVIEAPRGDVDPPEGSGPEVLLPFTLAAADWRPEGDGLSRATISNVGTGGDAELKVGYALAPGAPAGQYISAASRELLHDSVDRIEFTARADKPMRLSVQVRLRSGRSARWIRSVYVDPSPRRISVPLSELEPADLQTSQRPVAAPLQSMLFVVDTLNTPPATTGTFWISRLAFRKVQ